MLVLTTRDVVQRKEEEHNQALGLFEDRSRRDLLCRKEVGLEPIIVLEHDWWALGRIKVSCGAHDTYFREGVRVMMGFAKDNGTMCKTRDHVRCEFLGRLDFDTWYF